MSLPTPIGRQREVLYLPAQGHTAVLGTAGSGKTTLAILRAAYLGDSRTRHSGKVLLVTFNKALVTYLKHLAEKELPNVVVEHYHLFGRGYLKSIGKMRYGCICAPEERDRLITQAVTAILPKGQEKLTNTVDWLQAVRWTYQLGYDKQAQAVASLQSAPLNLTHDQARQVWTIRKAYEALRAGIGKDFDWDDVALAVDRGLHQDETKRKYKHVVIDEGQDFSPIMIRSLTRVVEPGGSVTFFGDIAQQIYGNKFSWRSAGLAVNEPWKFEENYRNTKQIADLAIALTKRPFFLGGPDLVSPRSARAAGPLPVIVQFSAKRDEIQFIVERAIASSHVGTAAILVRDREDEKLFTSRIKGFIRLHRDLDRWYSDQRSLYRHLSRGQGI